MFSPSSRSRLWHPSQSHYNAAETQGSVNYAGLGESTAEARYVDMIERQFCDAMNASDSEGDEEGKDGLESNQPYCKSNGNSHFSEKDIESGIRGHNETTMSQRQSGYRYFLGTAELQHAETQESLYYTGMSENSAEAHFMAVIQQQFRDAMNDTITNNGDKDNDNGNCRQRDNPLRNCTMPENKLPLEQGVEMAEKSTLGLVNKRMIHHDKEEEDHYAQGSKQRHATLDTRRVLERLSPAIIQREVECNRDADAGNLNSVNSKNEQNYDEEKDHTSQGPAHNEAFLDSPSEKLSLAIIQQEQECKREPDARLVEPVNEAREQCNEEEKTHFAQGPKHKQASLDTRKVSERLSSATVQQQEEVNKEADAGIQLEGFKPEVKIAKQHRRIDEGLTTATSLVPQSGCSWGDTDEVSDNSVQSQPLLTEGDLTQKEPLFAESNKKTNGSLSLPPGSNSQRVQQLDIEDDNNCVVCQKSEKMKDAATHSQYLRKDFSPSARDDITSQVPTEITVQRTGKQCERISKLTAEEIYGSAGCIEESPYAVEKNEMHSPYEESLSCEKASHDSLECREDQRDGARVSECLTSVRSPHPMQRTSTKAESPVLICDQKDCLSNTMRFTANHCLKEKVKSSAVLESPSAIGEGTASLPRYEKQKNSGPPRKKRPKTTKKANDSGWITKRKRTIFKPVGRERATDLYPGRAIPSSGDKENIKIGITKEESAHHGNTHLIDRTVVFLSKGSPHGIVSLDASPIPTVQAESVSVPKKKQKRQAENGSELKDNQNTQHRMKSRRFRPVARASEKRLTQTTLTEMFK